MSQWKVPSGNFLGNILVFFQNSNWFKDVRPSRYKTKRAQHEKGMHDQQNNPLPSPRRVAVPVLVRDGKPCLNGGPKPEGLQVPGPMMMGSHPAPHLLYGQPRVWW